MDGCLGCSKACVKVECGFSVNSEASSTVKVTVTDFLLRDILKVHSALLRWIGQIDIRKTFLVTVEKRSFVNTLRKVFFVLCC